MDWTCLQPDSAWPSRPRAETLSRDPDLAPGSRTGRVQAVGEASAWRRAVAALALRECSPMFTSSTACRLPSLLLHASARNPGKAPGCPNAIPQRIGFL